jgi:hypothetical protein
VENAGDKTAAYHALAGAYHALAGAYRQAYGEAEATNDLNRALVFNYIATSSKAVVSEIHTTMQEPELAKEADGFAKAAMAKDEVRAGLGIGKFLWKLVPGSAVLAIAVALGTFLVTLLSQANSIGENVGAGLGGVALSGGAIYFIVRAAGVAAQGAAKVGEDVLEAIGDAFASNARAKRIVRGLGPAEARFLGPSHGLKRAQRGRWVVDLTGPATGLGLTVLIAIPLVLVAVAIGGAVSGYEKHDDPSPYPSGYEYTPPSEPSGFPE